MVARLHFYPSPAKTNSCGLYVCRAARAARSAEPRGNVLLPPWVNCAVGARGRSPPLCRRRRGLLCPWVNCAAGARGRSPAARSAALQTQAIRGSVERVSGSHAQARGARFLRPWLGHDLSTRFRRDRASTRMQIAFWYIYPSCPLFSGHVARCWKALSEDCRPKSVESCFSTSGGQHSAPATFLHC